MAKPTLAVWKFASCDGCQLALLDLEDELLTVAGAVEIAHFPEATSVHRDGPYDVSLVEGSISTPADLERIQRIRAQSGLLVAIGACATAGGIQALRNLANVEEYVSAVYARPEYIDSLASSTPLSQHVDVDFQLQGCPINKLQLLELIKALLTGRRPVLPSYSVCLECKARGTACVMACDGIPCMGPITQAGCGAICPAFRRGCYGCYGPSESPNIDSLASWWEHLGVPSQDFVRSLRSFNAAAREFQEAGTRHAQS